MTLMMVEELLDSIISRSLKEELTLEDQSHLWFVMLHSDEANANANPNASFLMTLISFYLLTWSSSSSHFIFFSLREKLRLTLAAN